MTSIRFRMNSKFRLNGKIAIALLTAYAVGTIVYFGYQSFAGLDPTLWGAVANASDLPMHGGELSSLTTSGPWLWIFHGREPRCWLLVSVHCSEVAIRRFAAEHKLGELGFQNDEARRAWEAEVEQFRRVATDNSMTAIPATFDSDDLYGIAGDSGWGEIELAYRKSDGVLVMFIAK
jgi:hypothetical protein